MTLMKPQLIGAPHYLLGDPDRLRGILLNLYTNAAKFTRRGAIGLMVSVHGSDYRPKPGNHTGLFQPRADQARFRPSCLQGWSSY